MYVHRIFFRNVFAGLIAIALSPSQGADVDYSAAIQVTSYSNLNQEYQSPGTEISESVRGEVSLTEDTANLNANLISSVEAINFENNQANDETVYSLLGDLMYSIYPNSLQWYVSEIYTQTPIDNLIGDVSINRQYANAFSTGPNYLMRFNTVNSLELQARVGDYQYEINDADNQRLSGTVIWPMRLSRAFTFALNYELEAVEFASHVEYQDYQRADYFMSAHYEHGNSILEIEYGQIGIDYDVAVSTDEIRYMFAAESTRTSESHIRLEVSRMLMDTASLLESQIGQEVQFYRLTSTSSDLFVSKLVSLIYNYDIAGGVVMLQLDSEENRYETQVEEDYDRTGSMFQFDWHATQTSNIIFQARADSIDRFNVTPQRTVDDLNVSLSYRYGIRRNLVLNYQASYQERDSIVNTESFEDTRFLISLIYTSL